MSTRLTAMNHKDQKTLSHKVVSNFEHGRQIDKSVRS